jgi:SAM-dependent methyltransferase
MGRSVLTWDTATVRLRLRSFHAFLRETLPAPPAGVLEIGCGDGTLALSLAKDGYEVTAIDPEAPEGAIFRRTRLEDYDADPESFDAVVASVSLHHVHDLEAAVDKLERLLRPGGRLVLAEFAKERLDGVTARWYHAQRTALSAVGREDARIEPNFDAWRLELTQVLDDVHPATDLLASLARFREIRLEWTPYLYDYRLDDSLEPAERVLIESGEIEPVGFLYVGERWLQA